MMNIFDFIKDYSDYYAELQPIKEIIIDLFNFKELYENRKEYIYELPLIPFESHILNKNYFDKYLLIGNLTRKRNSSNNPVLINIYVNSVYISEVEIEDFKFLLAIINNLKTDKDDEPKFFNIGTKNNVIYYNPRGLTHKIKIGNIQIHETSNNDNYFFNNILDELIKIRNSLLKHRSELRIYIGKEDKYYLNYDDLMYEE